MISYKQLGKNGMLGNQLFQYAFLRTQAEKLGVKFYCPKWIGDEVFDLCDGHLRAAGAEGIVNNFVETQHGNYDRDNLNICDNTDIYGYFESEKNFDKSQVKSWFSFKKDKVERLDEKYKKIDFSKSTAVHCRFGDKLNRMPDKIFCYVPPVTYYEKALKKIKPAGNILVFSDDIELAKKILSQLPYDFLFIEGNNAWEDLYLITKCQSIVCTASTFSWWGAWLGKSPDKVVIYPKEGNFRPFGTHVNKDLIPTEWIKIRALRPLIDSYLVVTFPDYKTLIDVNLGKIGKWLKGIFPSLYSILKSHSSNDPILLGGNKSFNPNSWETYYINLDIRTDRKKNIELEFKRIGINAQRFSALKDDFVCSNLKLGENNIPNLSDRKNPVTDRLKGEWGCAFSNYSILKRHLESGSDNILAIFEDDAHFCADFTERLKYLESNFNLDWDIFYLNADIKLPYNKKTGIKYVWKIDDVIYCCHSMLINPKSLSRILKLLEQYAPNVSAIDHLYCYLIPHINAYCFVPGIVSQKSDKPGDINNRIDVTSLHTNDYGKHVFAEKINDYDYGRTSWFRKWFDYGRLYLPGHFGKIINNFSPRLYSVLKAYSSNTSK